MKALAAIPAPRAVQRSAVAPASAASPAPVFRDAGAPLPDAVRPGLEAGFGRDLSAVRVHDDAATHDAARALGARAFAAGSDIGFASGALRPEDARGRALIGHEVAHAVQQAPLARSPDAAAPAALIDDSRLEAEAERAGAAVAEGRPAPALTAAPAPAIQRAVDAPETPAAPQAEAPAPQADSAAPPAPANAPPPPETMPEKPADPAKVRLPEGMTAIVDEPAGLGTGQLVVALDQFDLPLEKGAGDWVQKAHDDAGAGGRLVFSPIITGGSVAAFKEGGETYKIIWANALGFSDEKALAKAFNASEDADVVAARQDAEVAKRMKALEKGLAGSQFNVDHIVEKQMGGTSIPSNLQLLDANKNQASGRETYTRLKGLVEAIRHKDMRGPKVTTLQIRMRAAKVPTGTADPSVTVEKLLRAGKVAGDAEVKKLADGSPLALTAGGQGETVSVRPKGETPIDAMAKRIVPGVRLLKYVRKPAQRGASVDQVDGELDSSATTKAKAGASAIRFEAHVPAIGQGADPGANPGAAAPEGGPAPAGPAAEARILKLNPKTPQKIAFFYPYLSPGEFTKLSLNAAGGLVAEGTIASSVPMLGKFAVIAENDTLRAALPLTPDRLKSPLPSAFRFTGGEIALQLSPSFVPSGEVTFEIGPRGKPVIVGRLSVAIEAGVFVARGDLKPGGKVPGIDSAEGSAIYSSDKGWSGMLKAATSSIPNSETDVEFGFTQKGAALVPKGTGAIRTTLRGKTLDLRVAWGGGPVSYSGSVRIPKPLPMVESVTLDGAYSEAGLALVGETELEWKGQKGRVKVFYEQPAGKPGRFRGEATVDIRNEKLDGRIELKLAANGGVTGKGELGYQVTKTLRPRLGVELTEDERVKITGEVTVPDIPLGRKWPSEKGGEIPILKDVGVKFSVPTPVPAVTAYAQITGSLGLGYGVGPVTISAVKFRGELYPFEDDPKIKARLTGKLAVPGYGELYGKFGAYLGVEVAAGAVGAKGGVTIAPSLRISGEAGIAVDAAYENRAFSFSAVAYAKGRLDAKAAVDLEAEIYAAWGVFSHTWTYNVASVSAQIGPEVTLTLGRIAYRPDGTIEWPSVSQVEARPDVSPMAVIKDMLGRGKANKT